MLQKAFDGLLWLLLFAISIMWLTGGMIFDLPIGKIEASSLDPWMIVFCLLIVLRVQFSSIPCLPWLATQAFSNRLFASNRGFWVLLVWVLGLLFIGHCLRHWSLQTDTFDLVFVHQPLFWPWGDRPLHCDVCIGGSYFGEHLSYTLFLLAPLIAPIQSNEWVFFVEVLLMGGSFWALCFWGPLLRHQWLPALLVILCHRALRNSMIWDFREDHLAFAFLLGTCLALWRRKWGLYGVLGVLALLSKENIGLILPFLAGTIWFQRDLSRRTRLFAGLGTILVSAVWVVISFRFLIPSFSAGVESANNIVLRFPGLGQTTSEVVINLLSSPDIWWDRIIRKFFEPLSLKYLVLLIFPFAFFARKAWSWWIPMLPGIAMNLLSSAETQRSLQFHYELFILPFLLMALVVGMSRTPKNQWVIGILLALCFSGRWPGLEIQRYWPEKKEIAQSFYLRTVPNDGILAATPRLLAQLTHVQRLRHYRLPQEDPRSYTDQEAWTRFWENSDRNRSHLPSHAARTANRLVLDLNERWQNRIYSIALEKGWKEVSKNEALVLLKK